LGKETTTSKTVISSHHKDDYTEGGKDWGKKCRGEALETDLDKQLRGGKRREKSISPRTNFNRVGGYFQSPKGHS